MTNYPVKDYIYDASEDNKGIIILEGAEAVKNALKLWLVSFKGDMIRRPDFGGYVTQWLFKSMDEDTRFDIRTAIRVGLEREFSPNVVIDSVKVTPDYVRESWEIEIAGWIPALQEEIHVIENLRKQT